MEKKFLEKKEYVQKITRSNAGNITKNDDYPTLSAIVVFSDLSAKKAVLETYKKSNQICADKIDSMMIDGKKFEINQYVD